MLIVLYVLFFAGGAGPIPWVYLPEVLPDDIKGPAQVPQTPLQLQCKIMPCTCRANEAPLGEAMCIELVCCTIKTALFIVWPLTKYTDMVADKHDSCQINVQSIS